MLVVLRVEVSPSSFLIGWKKKLGTDKRKKNPTDDDWIDSKEYD
jgi:hypothetical protein